MMVLVNVATPSKRVVFRRGCVTNEEGFRLVNLWTSRLHGHRSRQGVRVTGTEGTRSALESLQEKLVTTDETTATFEGVPPFFNLRPTEVVPNSVQESHCFDGINGAAGLRLVLDVQQNDFN